MVSHQLFDPLRLVWVLLFETNLDAINCLADVVSTNQILLFSGGKNSRLIHNVLKVSTGHTKTSFGDVVKRDLRGEGFVSAVNLEDLDSSFVVG